MRAGALVCATVASGLVASLAALPASAAPSLRRVNERQADVVEGLVYVRAVEEELRARKEDSLTEEQARNILELHLALKRSNPNGDYEPAKVSTCPPAPTDQPGGSTGYFRDATSNEINSREADYINRHRQSVQSSWTQWLSSASPGPNLNIPGGVDNYTRTVDNLPRVGIAVSGGGYRAMLYGAGVIQGWDSRNGTANKRGTGGILQRANYFAGLSGGSWLTGALALNDWPTPQTLNEQVFDLTANLVAPDHGKIELYLSLVKDVKEKRDADWPTAITDYWGRALSRHLLNSSYPDHGAATTWSDIVNVTSFKNAAYPFPIVIADQRNPGEILVHANTSIYEFTPYEFGTWHRTAGFIPTQVLGSNISSDGSITQCILGYDNAGWVMGTSSTLFNGLFTQLISSDGSSLIKDAILGIAGAVASQNNDISQVPNSFQNWNVGAQKQIVAGEQYINLVDGGEDNNNIPIQPLLEPGRDLDFILALDSSADVTSWPNGSALYQAHLRAGSGAFDNVPTPYFPPTETFVNRGLNTRPVFFGCDAANATNAKTAARGVLAPIVAYIPNYPYSSLSNFSTFKLEYSAQESQSMLDNGVELATLAGHNATWAQCLACGMLERSWARSGVTRPDECTKCMDTYCWDGVENNTVPANAYSPPVGLPDWVKSTSMQKSPPFTGGDGSTTSLNSNGAVGLARGLGCLLGFAIALTAMATIL
ncbi:unnamed protein product [Parajaminaea phylloscopi]